MKKIVRLSENELVHLVKKIIEEQSENCPKVKVPKNTIDSLLPKLQSELKSKLEEITRDVFKQKNSIDSKIMKILIGGYDDLISQNFNSLLDIGVKTNYARFGVTGPYDQTSDIRKLVDNLKNTINSKLDSSLLLRGAANLYINKKNIDQVKKESVYSLSQILHSLNRLLLTADYRLRNEIFDKIGRCPNGEEFKAWRNNDMVKQYRIFSERDRLKSEIFSKLDKYV
jgi:hypothetical protein